MTAGKFSSMYCMYKEFALCASCTVFLSSSSFSVFTRNGDLVTVTTPSDSRWLQVEFRPHVKGGEGEKEEEGKRIKVLATGSTVSSFRLCVVPFLSLRN